MGNWVKILTDDGFLDKAGIAGVAIVAVVVAVWLLLRYTSNQNRTIVKMMTDAQDRQANAHVQALTTIQRSIDNNTSTVQSLESRMGDFQGTLSELYGFLRFLMGKDGKDDQK